MYVRISIYLKKSSTKKKIYLKVNMVNSFEYLKVKKFIFYF